MAKQYYIDFSGYCVIDAENEEEAMSKFWEDSPSGDIYDEIYYEIDSIEIK